MDWTDPIDGYCERVGAGFWAEPLNAVSNLAFILAAIVAHAAWRKAAGDGLPERRARDLAGLCLVALVAVIGVGSFLFHTFADRWSSLADVLPITVFIYAYFGLALHRLVGVGRAAAALATAAFLIFSLFADTLFGKVAGSSAGYVPAFLALLGIGFWLMARGGPQAGTVFAAGLVFAVSLSMRMADAPLCEAVPVGTHFVWHLLNATTLCLLLLAAVREGPRRRKKKITA